ncbi:N-6 DNA methylase [uncultured Halomonas sp.]|uniref:N-6 DNA methylase n=1 Tax=uncultured Halomonas sp. TaxID=173971 RepID=UPI00260200FC|nr:N-6 DNA methylase [uncultured Halomonas sp.]
MFSPLIDTLRDQGLKSHVTVQHASLLSAWAWCYRHRPELSLPDPKDRPGITVAMQAMKKALEAAGWSSSVAPDYLEMNCTGRTVQDLQDMVATLEWPDARGVVTALANLAEQALGQQAGQSQLPLELAKLMVKLGRTSGHRVVAAYPMSDVPMALADEAAERTYASTSHSALSDALVLISGASVVTETPSADVVLSVPPMGDKIPDISVAGKRRNRRSEAVGLQKAWERSTGRAVVLMLAGTLFDMVEYELRENLVRDNAIDMIIQLPGQTLPGTATPPVLVVLDHQREPESPVTFIDASRLVADSTKHRIKPPHQSPEFWEDLNQLVTHPSAGSVFRQASQSEIERNDFDLSVNRYVMGDATQKMADLDNARPLQDVAEIVRAQTLKSEQEEGSTLFIEVGGRDIDTSGQVRIEEPPKELHVAGRARKRAEQQQLQPGDVLLISKGSIGRVALVGSECGDNWVAGQVFLILRTKERGLMQPEYLYRYLASPMVQQYLEEIASGAGIPILKANDIKNLPVPVPSQEEQKRVLDVHQQIMDEYDAIRVHQAKIEELSQQHWAL